MNGSDMEDTISGEGVVSLRGEEDVEVILWHKSL